MVLHLCYQEALQVPADKVKQHGVGEPVDDTASRSLWLNLREIPTATYSVAKTIMAPGFGQFSCSRAWTRQNLATREE